MSNVAHHSTGYFVYPGHRPARNAIVSPGAGPANPQQQQQQQRIVMGPIPHSHSSAPVPASSFHEVSLHSPQSFPISSPSDHSAGAIVPHPALMSTPVSRSQFASYAPMETFPMAHADDTVSASDLHIEPRSLYPAELHSHTMPFFTGSADFGPVGPYFGQHPESPLDQRLSSPSQMGSPHEAASPSVAGSGISDKPTDQPYAKLIFEALKGAPNNSMVLKQIYAWFEKYTDKPQRAPAGKQGWKNSIRHNLSMNEAFEKVVPANIQEREGNKGCIWRLSNKALAENNVLSTTRYRTKNTSSSKRRQSSVVLHQRQGNGGKIMKRSPGPEPANSNRDNMSFQSGLPETHMQDFMISSPYTSAHYPYPSPQIFSDPTSYPSDMAQTPALVPSFHGDNHMFGGSFTLYGDPAGTPASTVSTAESVPHELVTIGDRTDLKMDIELEGADIDGVSSNAHEYDLFAPPDAHDNAFLASEDAKDGNLASEINASQAEYQSMLSLDEFTNWPLGQFEQMSSQEQAPFSARL